MSAEITTKIAATVRGGRAVHRFDGTPVLPHPRVIAFGEIAHGYSSAAGMASEVMPLPGHVAILVTGGGPSDLAEWEFVHASTAPTYALKDAEAAKIRQSIDHDYINHQIGALTDARDSASVNATKFDTMLPHGCFDESFIASQKKLAMKSLAGWTRRLHMVLSNEAVLV